MRKPHPRVPSPRQGAGSREQGAGTDRVLSLPLGCCYTKAVPGRESGSRPKAPCGDGAPRHPALWTLPGRAPGTAEQVPPEDTELPQKCHPALAAGTLPPALC